MENTAKKPKEKPKYNMAQNASFMLRRAWNGNRTVPLFCVVTALLAVGASVLELFIAPMILDRVESHAPLAELLRTILLFSGALLLVQALKAYIEENAYWGKIDLRTKLISDLHTKLGRTSFPNTEDADILAKAERAFTATGSNDQATEAVWQTLADLLRDVLGFGIYLLMLSNLDPVLIAVILVTTVAGYLVNKRLNEWGYRHREELAGYEKKIDYINARAEDVKLAKDVRIFGLQSWLEDIYELSMKGLRNFLERREKIYVWTNVIDAVLAFLRNGIAYYYLIAIALRGGLTVAEFLLYFTAVSGFTTWVTGILNQLGTLHKQSLDISTVREFLELPEPFLFEGGDPVEIDPGKSYELTLEHVSFRYPGAEEDTLHDINLTIPAGENLAVVGLNGAGKTTLVKLLCGFYDPTEGRVLLNGKDIREFDRRQYYRLFSAVFQQFSVLAVSVAENVAQTDTAIDEQRVLDCLDKAGLSEKIAELPQGIKTHIGKEVYEDGVELSGGQTQRLMLARALYKNGPILVLDEPTAALDPIAENDIYLKYNEMTKGRTSVFISHRMASTRFCDRILFLAGGGIAEEGTHESLLKQGGKYAELFQVQARYYQEGADFRGEGEN